MKIFELIRSVKKNNSNNHQLAPEEWGNIYNKEQVDSLIQAINQKNYSVQTKELLDIIPSGSKTLEIGSGTGQTSLCLAQKSCIVSILDYELKCLELSKIAAEKLQLQINTICFDATKELPFEENQFDVIFHAGLLEHFTKDERITLLKKWKKYGKTMISLVPNAACVAYRVGKAIMEKNGTWIYGIEMPLYTQIDEFLQAGYKVEKEYTIGIEHALNFLEKTHPLRETLEKCIETNQIANDYQQGYLLVTVGVKSLKGLL